MSPFVGKINVWSSLLYQSAMAIVIVHHDSIYTFMESTSSNSDTFFSNSTYVLLRRLKPFQNDCVLLNSDDPVDRKLSSVDANYIPVGEHILFVMISRIRTSIDLIRCLRKIKFGRLFKIRVSIIITWEIYVCVWDYLYVGVCVYIGHLKVRRKKELLLNLL